MNKTLIVALGAGLCAGAFAQAPSATNLGAIYDTQAAYSSADFATNYSGATTQVLWYKFFISNNITSASGLFLDIDTTPQAVGGTNSDMEIGVYTSAGVLVATDDDDGVSLHSSLTFGQTAPTRSYTFGTLTAMTAANGRDGALNSGWYYLAVASWQATFGTTNWGVTSASTTSSWVGRVNFRTNAVPEPGTLAALGLGAAAMIRRRKK